MRKANIESRYSKSFLLAVVGLTITKVRAGLIPGWVNGTNPHSFSPLPTLEVFEMYELFPLLILIGAQRKLPPLAGTPLLIVVNENMHMPLIYRKLLISKLLASRSVAKS